MYQKRADKIFNPSRCELSAAGITIPTYFRLQCSTVGLDIYEWDMQNISFTIRHYKDMVSICCYNVVGRPMVLNEIALLYGKHGAVRARYSNNQLLVNKTFTLDAIGLLIFEHPEICDVIPPKQVLNDIGIDFRH